MPCAAPGGSCTLSARLNFTHSYPEMFVWICIVMQDHYENAVFHFQQLLDRKPCHWTALCQLVMLLRKAGRLPEVAKFLTAAEAAAAKLGFSEGGLHFCKGLQQR